MRSAAKIRPQPWMRAPGTRAVVAALTAEGTEVRFVGGCVRDAMLGRPVADVDIATPDRPETVMRLLEKAGIKAVPTGLSHGTVTAVVGRARFEITTLRRDVETFGRRARVRFTDDWEADAARRDFTINALSLSPDGRLYDPFAGLDDLRAGRVRFVGEPERRIREDVLRLLRFFRFYAHYGKPPPDEAGLAACRRLAHLLPTLSGERVGAELLKLLAAPDPAPVLALMAEEGILAHVLPEARRFARLGALVALEAAHARPDPLRRLAAVLEGDADAARAVAARLRFSNRWRDRLAAMADGMGAYAPEAEARARRRRLYRLGADLCTDVTLLHWADRLDRGPAPGPREEDVYKSELAEAAAWKAPALPVAGRDVVACGVPPGPRVGALLAELEAWWIAGDFRATRAEALARLRALAGAQGGGAKTRKARK